MRLLICILLIVGGILTTTASAAQLNGYDPTTPNPTTPHVTYRSDCDQRHAGGEAQCRFRVTIGGSVEDKEVLEFYNAMESLRALRRQANRLVEFQIELNSEGGPLWSAIQVGLVVRAQSGHAFVGNSEKCVSACVLILLAAPHRMVMPGGRVGIHKPYANVYMLPDDAARSDALARKGTKSYVLSWGGAIQIVDDMWAIPTECMRYLTGKELEDYGITLERNYLGESSIAC